MANLEAKGDSPTKKARKSGTSKGAAISLKEIFDEDDNKIFDKEKENQAENKKETDNPDSSATESEDEDTPEKRQQLVETVDTFFDEKI